MYATVAFLAEAAPAALAPARSQMALSLGFHIVLSCFGVAFPTVIWLMHTKALRGDADALLLAQRWSKVAAVLFAVGAVSGTVLSFEMGLLWPTFMERFGDVIGLAFAMEGIAFFTEAIFLGLYLYGWGRVPLRTHRLFLLPIMVAGMFGTFCILAVNAWMNSPSGFSVSPTGEIIDIDPLAAIFNDAVWWQFVHMWVAAFMVVGFLVAAVYSRGMLKGRDDTYHRLGFAVPFAVAALAALAQPVIGHMAGARLAEAQPAKLAAIELAPRTETNAPLRIGGWFVDDSESTRGAIEIPGLGSLLATGSVDGEVPGFFDQPEDARPRTRLGSMVHLAFQSMVAIGFALIGLSAWWFISRRRGNDPLASRRFLWCATAAGPAAVLALQFGWIVTEVGRQPWIVNGYMRIDEAVTSSEGVWITFALLATAYAALGTISIGSLRTMARRWRDGESIDLETPYSLSSITPKAQSTESEISK